MTVRPSSFCPIHEDLVTMCSYQCLVERVEYARAAHALRVYWYDRRRLHKVSCRNKAHADGCGHRCAAEEVCE